MYYAKTIIDEYEAEIDKAYQGGFAEAEKKFRIE
jgi:hypothetical protein